VKDKALHNSLFHDWLRQLRRTLRYTQVEFAEHLGYSVATIRKLERYELRPSRAFAECLADFLKIQATERAAFVRAVTSSEAPTPTADKAYGQLSSATLTLPRGTVTFLLAEIDGSTRLWEEHRKAMKTIRHRFMAALRTAVTTHGGTVFKTAADAVYAAFANAPDALAAAVGAQRVFQATAWEEIGHLPVRMVLHTGSVEVQDDDFVGLTLNRATQLLRIGHAGQVLLSRATADLAREALPEGTHVRDLGDHYLPDQPYPEQIFQIVTGQQPAYFPPLRTPAVRPHNLPSSPTPLLGREQEITATLDLLQRDDVRLITLCGPGGIGKTHLALAVAELQVANFEDGVYFVPLAPVTVIDHAISAIAHAIKFAFYGSSNQREELLTYMSDKHMLLVLDNFEQLRASSNLITDIVRYAPDIKVLVTSRERLTAQGQTVIELHGLAFPPSGQGHDVEAYSSVELFLRSAERSSSAFRPSSSDIATVARICRLTEGMPLAIELAAAWVPTLSCAEIAAEIEKGIEILVRPLGNASERHDSIRAVFDHSWSLLAPEEQCVLRLLSIFRGGFQRAAAEQVAGASLPILAALVSKSLLHRDDAGRYDMHQLVVQYARRRLAEITSDQSAAQEHHCRYFADFLFLRAKQLRGKQQLQALEEIRGEIDNVRQAWQWAVDHGKIDEIKQSLQSLLDFYDTQGWFQEGESAFKQAVDRLTAIPPSSEEFEAQLGIMLGQIHAGHGWLCMGAGQFGQAKEALLTSLSLMRKYGAHQELMNPLTSLGMGAYIIGDYMAAQELLSESLAIQRSIGDRWAEGWSLGLLGWALFSEGKYQEAHALVEEMVQIYLGIGDPRLIGLAFSTLSLVTSALGDYGEAQRLARESVVISREIRHPWGEAIALCHLGIATYLTENYAQARDLYEQSLQIFQVTGNPWGCSQALVGLAEATLTLGEIARAYELACQAAKIACDAQLWPIALRALLVLSMIAAKTGELNLALELVGLPLCHRASAYDTKGRASILVADLEARVSGQEILRVKEKWNTLSINYAVVHLLAFSNN
jgi:predicted ATPase/class 3 adenylate cyclase